VKWLRENRNHAPAILTGLENEFVTCGDDNGSCAWRRSADPPAHFSTVHVALQRPRGDNNVGTPRRAEPNAFGGGVGDSHVMFLDSQRASQNVSEERIRFDN
jgi:hypothetical protein